MQHSTEQKVHNCHRQFQLQHCQLSNSTVCGMWPQKCVERLGILKKKAVIRASKEYNFAPTAKGTYQRLRVQQRQHLQLLGISWVDAAIHKWRRSTNVLLLAHILHILHTSIARHCVGVGARWTDDNQQLSWPSMPVFVRSHFWCWDTAIYRPT